MKFVVPEFKGYIVVIFFSLIVVEIFRWVLTNIFGFSFSGEFFPYLSFMKMVGLTAMGWFIAHAYSYQLAKKFFELSRYHFMHFIPSFRKISYEEIFLTSEKKSYWLLFLITFASCHFFSSLIAYAITLPWEIAGADQEFIEFQILLMAGAVSPITATLVFPILILFSSNVRLSIKSKKIISSSFSSFKYLIFSIWGVSAFSNAYISLNFQTESFFVLYFTWVPSMILAILFAGGSIRPLTNAFRTHLDTLGIKEKDYDLH